MQPSRPDSLDSPPLERRRTHSTPSLNSLLSPTSPIQITLERRASFTRDRASSIGSHYSENGLEPMPEERPITIGSKLAGGTILIATLPSLLSVYYRALGLDVIPWKSSRETVSWSVSSLTSHLWNRLKNVVTQDTDWYEIEPDEWATLAKSPLDIPMIPGAGIVAKDFTLCYEAPGEDVLANLKTKGWTMFTHLFQHANFLHWATAGYTYYTSVVSANLGWFKTLFTTFLAGSIGVMTHTASFLTQAKVNGLPYPLVFAFRGLQYPAMCFLTIDFMKRTNNIKAYHERLNLLKQDHTMSTFKNTPDGKRVRMVTKQYQELVDEYWSFVGKSLLGMISVLIQGWYLIGSNGSTKRVDSVGVLSGDGSNMSGFSMGNASIDNLIDKKFGRGDRVIFVGEWSRVKLKKWLKDEEYVVDWTRRSELIAWSSIIALGMFIGRGL